MATINHQPQKEYEKNFMRIKNIIIKATVNGVLDEDKALKIGATEANRITKEWKAINRAKIAIELGYEFLAEPFFEVAFRLGDNAKVEYRLYRLKQLNDLLND